MLLESFFITSMVRISISLAILSEIFIQTGYNCI